jgi:ribosomal protein S20
MKRKKNIIASSIEAIKGDKSLAKKSRATAVREIDHLMKLGIIKQNPGRGRSASYELKI